MDETQPEPAGELLRVPRRLVNKLRVISAVRRRPMMELIEEYAADRIDAEHKAAIEEQTLLVPDLGDPGA